MNYDSLSPQFAGELANRFPRGADGVATWQNTAMRMPTIIPEFDPPSQQTQVPRVFVSYKSQDRDYALRLAYLCDQQGFEYWLDVEDPVLTGVSRTPSSQQKAVLIATIIEIALLNSTHVIATMTKLTEQSTWVPYEFGRVKDQTVVADESCSWVHPIQRPKLAEYLYLCPYVETENAVENWLEDQRLKWEGTARREASRPCR